MDVRAWGYGGDDIGCLRLTYGMKTVELVEESECGYLAEGYDSVGHLNSEWHKLELAEFW